MSTDLKFITNESGQTLSNRFADLLRGHTRFFDCLVGCFYVSGFFRIYRSLGGTEKVRILSHHAKASSGRFQWADACVIRKAIFYQSGFAQGSRTRKVKHQ